MKILKILAVLGLMAAVAGCSKFQTYTGPEVTRVAVFKSSRSIVLYSGEQVLEAFRMELGFAPDGPKEFEGDGKTPEGRYFIDRRNPNSSYHLSLGISYPNQDDRARASSMGKSPGGDIFIHGQKNLFFKGGDDWTAGCIAVTNREIEKIYAMVRDGTPIDIYP